MVPNILGCADSARLDQTVLVPWADFARFDQAVRLQRQVDGGGVIPP